MNKRKLLALSLPIFIFFAQPAKSEEVYTMFGHVENLVNLIGPTEIEPSTVAGVVTVDSEPVWNSFRVELEGQFMKHWQGLAVGTRFDLGPNLHLLIGSGAGYLDADLDYQRDGFNFLLQGGVGCRLGDWRADLRFHHISNAQLRQPNSGLNEVLILVGRKW
jgi:hypothetical protein